VIVPHPLVTMAAIVVVVSRVAETFVHESEQKAVQRRCDDLACALHAFHPIKFFAPATGRLPRMMMLAAAAALFTAHLTRQFLNTAPHLTGNAAGANLAAYLTFLLPALVAVWVWGPRLSDWLHSDGDVQKANGRILTFLAQTALIGTAAGVVGHSLLLIAALLAPAVPAAAFGAFLAGLLLWAVPAAFLGLWIAVIVYAYVTALLGLLLVAAEGVVRFLFAVMWRVSLSPKGAVSALCALIGIIAGVAQAALAGR